MNRKSRHELEPFVYQSVAHEFRRISTGYVCGSGASSIDTFGYIFAQLAFFLFDVATPVTVYS
jgi:hypothetical protein